MKVWFTYNITPWWAMSKAFPTKIFPPCTLVVCQYIVHISIEHQGHLIFLTIPASVPFVHNSLPTKCQAENWEIEYNQKRGFVIARNTQRNYTLFYITWDIWASNWIVRNMKRNQLLLTTNFCVKYFFADTKVDLPTCVVPQTNES